MTGITRDELMQMARDAGFSYETWVNSCSEYLERLTNAILERAAVEINQKVVRMSNEIHGTSFYIAVGQSVEAVRALKINTGD